MPIPHCHVLAGGIPTARSDSTRPRIRLYPRHRSETPKSSDSQSAEFPEAIQGLSCWEMMEELAKHMSHLKNVTSTVCRNPQICQVICYDIPKDGSPPGPIQPLKLSQAPRQKLDLMKNLSWLRTGSYPNGYRPFILVEDVTPDIIEAFVSKFGMNPEFFEEHLNRSGYRPDFYSDPAPDTGIPTLPPAIRVGQMVSARPSISDEATA
ncbi:hypothetical protein VTO42DRAFT_771 [Malbranchea cinnamomea]